ncbi:MAG: hypothetical protein HXS49_01040, partial [Theionarchaea archaeon]|nr:hypothetical protein [Theionarchaea archaeon]MBU7039448.1 hypothetical protein [Theionarchaea archaeon]
MNHSWKVEVLLLALALILLQCHSIRGAAEFAITTDVKDQWEPAVYGNIVVWT